MNGLDELSLWADGTDRTVWSDGIWRGMNLVRAFDSPVEHVWTAWTDPSALEVWFAPVTGALRQDGTVVIDVGMAEKTVSRILRCEAPNRLCATWVYGDDPTNPPGEVALYLKRRGHGTLLRLEHRSVDQKDWLAGVGIGWEIWLRRLDDYLRGAEPNAVRWEDMAPVVEPRWGAVADKPCPDE